MTFTPNIRRCLTAGLLSSSLWAAGALAQDPPPPLPPTQQQQTLPGAPAPLSPNGPAGRYKTPFQAAAPPADPQLPNWGNYAQPVPPPVGPLVLDYALAAPPDGVIQQNVPGYYRAPVADSESVWTRDALLNQTIDLWRPDGLAPVGVLQDATLRNGQFLFSYRFDYQNFANNYVGTQKVSNASIGANYPFVPTAMNIGRHLLIMQYGVTDDLTIFGELPFQHSALTYDVTGGGGEYRTPYTNPGDITLSAMYVLWRGNRQQIHLNLGMNFPVGFLNNQNYDPLPDFPNLPYVIRTGSGTYDLLPGLTYRGQTDAWSWGLQSIGTIRTGINRLDYKLGDRADLTVWLARRWTGRVSTSFRVDNQWWGNVRGADPLLNPTLSPVNDPNMQGGTRVDLLFGINLFLPNTKLPGQRFSIEGGAPVYQSLSGPQLGTNWLLNAGWNLVY